MPETSAVFSDVHEESAPDDLLLRQGYLDIHVRLALKRMIAHCETQSPEAPFSARGIVIDTALDIAKQVTDYFGDVVNVEPLLDDVVDEISANAVETGQRFHEVMFEYVNDGMPHARVDNAGFSVNCKWYSPELPITDDMMTRKKELRPGWSAGTSGGGDMLKYMSLGTKKGFLLVVSALDANDARATELEIPAEFLMAFGNDAEALAAVRDAMQQGGQALEALRELAADITELKNLAAQIETGALSREDAAILLEEKAAALAGHIAEPRFAAVISDTLLNKADAIADTAKHRAHVELKAAATEALVEAIATAPASRLAEMPLQADGRNDIVEAVRLIRDAAALNEISIRDVVALVTPNPAVSGKAGMPAATTLPAPVKAAVEKLAAVVPVIDKTPALREAIGTKTAERVTRIALAQSGKKPVEIPPESLSASLRQLAECSKSPLVSLAAERIALIPATGEDAKPEIRAQTVRRTGEFLKLATATASPADLPAPVRAQIKLAAVQLLAAARLTEKAAAPEALQPAKPVPAKATAKPDPATSAQPAPQTTPATGSTAKTAIRADNDNLSATGPVAAKPAARTTAQPVKTDIAAPAKQASANIAKPSATERPAVNAPKADASAAKTAITATVVAVAPAATEKPAVTKPATGNTAKPAGKPEAARANVSAKTDIASPAKLSSAVQPAATIARPAAAIAKAAAASATVAAGTAPAAAEKPLALTPAARNAAKPSSENEAARTPISAKTPAAAAKPQPASDMPAATQPRVPAGRDTIATQPKASAQKDNTHKGASQAEGVKAAAGKAQPEARMAVIAKEATAKPATAAPTVAKQASPAAVTDAKAPTTRQTHAHDAVKTVLAASTAKAPAAAAEPAARTASAPAVPAKPVAPAATKAEAQPQAATSASRNIADAKIPAARAQAETAPKATTIPAAAATSAAPVARTPATSSESGAKTAPAVTAAAKQSSPAPAIQAQQTLKAGTAAIEKVPVPAGAAAGTIKTVAVADKAGQPQPVTARSTISQVAHTPTAPETGTAAPSVKAQAPQAGAKTISSKPDAAPATAIPAAAKAMRAEADAPVSSTTAKAQPPQTGLKTTGSKPEAAAAAVMPAAPRAVATTPAVSTESPLPRAATPPAKAAVTAAGIDAKTAPAAANAGKPAEPAKSQPSKAQPTVAGATVPAAPAPAVAAVPTQASSVTAKPSSAAQGALSAQSPNNAHSPSATRNVSTAAVTAQTAPVSAAVAAAPEGKATAQTPAVALQKNVSTRSEQGATTLTAPVGKAETAAPATSKETGIATPVRAAGVQASAIVAAPVPESASKPQPQNAATRTTVTPAAKTAIAEPAQTGPKVATPVTPAVPTVPARTIGDAHPAVAAPALKTETRILAPAATIMPAEKTVAREAPTATAAAASTSLLAAKPVEKAPAQPRVAPKTAAEATQPARTENRNAPSAPLMPAPAAPLKAAPAAPESIATAQPVTARPATLVATQHTGATPVPATPTAKPETAAISSRAATGISALQQPAATPATTTTSLAREDRTAAAAPAPARDRISAASPETAQSVSVAAPRHVPSPAPLAARETASPVPVTEGKADGIRTTAMKTEPASVKIAEARPAPVMPEAGIAKAAVPSAAMPAQGTTTTAPRIISATGDNAAAAVKTVDQGKPALETPRYQPMAAPAAAMPETTVQAPLKAQGIAKIFQQQLPETPAVPVPATSKPEPARPESISPRTDFARQSAPPAQSLAQSPAPSSLPAASLPESTAPAAFVQPRAEPANPVAAVHDTGTTGNRAGTVTHTRTAQASPELPARQPVTPPIPLMDNKPVMTPSDNVPQPQAATLPPVPAPAQAQHHEQAAYVAPKGPDNGVRLPESGACNHGNGCNCNTGQLKNTIKNALEQQQQQIPREPEAYAAPKMEPTVPAQQQQLANSCCSSGGPGICGTKACPAEKLADNLSDAIKTAPRREEQAYAQPQAALPATPQAKTPDVAEKPAVQQQHAHQEPAYIAPKGPDNAVKLPESGACNHGNGCNCNTGQLKNAVKDALEQQQKPKEPEAYTAPKMEPTVPVQQQQLANTCCSSGGPGICGTKNCPVTSMADNLNDALKSAPRRHEEPASAKAPAESDYNKTRLSNVIPQAQRTEADRCCSTGVCGTKSCPLSLISENLEKSLAQAPKFADHKARMAAPAKKVA